MQTRTETNDSSPAESPAISVFLLASATVVASTASIDMARIPLVLIPASFLLAAYGAGQLFEHLARSYMPAIADDLTMLRLTRRLAIGIPTIGMIATLMGLCGIFHWLGIPMIAACGWGCCSLIQTGGWRGLRVHADTLVSGIGVGLVWTVAWLWGTVPPIFYDELVYHLPIPQFALRTGNLPASPWSYFTLMPHLSDLLLGWGLALGGDLGARALQLAFWFGIWIAAWGLIETIRSSSNSRIGLLLAGTFASSSTFFFLGTLPFAECSLTFAVIASIALMISNSAQPNRLPVGLLWGFIMSVKLSGPSWVVAGAIAALIVGWSARSVLIAAGIGVACAMPWWARAWILTGNPMYPLGYKWTGGRYWSDASEKLLQQDLPHFTDTSDLAAWLRLPYDMVAHPELFGSASDVGPIAVLGLCVMLSLPLWTTALNGEFRFVRISYAVSAFVAVVGSCWVLTSTTTRFFAPALMLGLALFPILILRLPRHAQTAAIVALTVCAIIGTDRFIAEHFRAFSSEQVVFGRESRSAYLARAVDHFESAQYVRDSIPSDARLLFIGESRPFYFDRAVLAPYPFHEHPLTAWLKEASSPDQVIERLRREGITHIVLNTREFKRLRDTYHVLEFDGADGPVLDQRLKRLPHSMTLLFAKNHVYVFEIPPLPQPAKHS